MFPKALDRHASVAINLRRSGGLDDVKALAFIAGIMTTALGQYTTFRELVNSFVESEKMVRRELSDFISRVLTEQAKMIQAQQPTASWVLLGESKPSPAEKKKDGNPSQ